MPYDRSPPSRAEESVRVNRRQAAAGRQCHDRPSVNQGVGTRQIRRIRSACCAHATSGHAAAAPPSSEMNSRRPMKAVT